MNNEGFAVTRWLLAMPEESGFWAPAKQKQA